jgi:hypothetical protein
MKIGKIVCLLSFALLPSLAAAQQLSPSQIALAQMAAAADAYKTQADTLSVENAGLQKRVDELKNKCGDPCKDAAKPQNSIKKEK